MGEKTISIYCDGGARGNPGPSAGAFVVVSNGKVLHKQAKYLGHATNNVAEYEAVILALTWLSEKGRFSVRQSVIVNLDSELVTKQMSGLYKIKNSKLKTLFLTAKKLESQLPFKIFYKWSPRSKNRLADFLVNKELDRNT
ncbi:MAG: ribonuclease HI family protein [Microgenomates group bacterium]